MKTSLKAGQKLWNSAPSGSNRENLIVATIRGRLASLGPLAQLVRATDF